MFPRWRAAWALAVVAAGALVQGAVQADSAPPTPQQLCASEPARPAVRRKLNDTAFVVCLKGQVWSTHSCPADPPGLTFNETSETCVP